MDAPVRSSKESLERKLSLQKLRFNRLLEITQAINNNIGISDLFKIYKDTLSWELQLQKFALFIHQDNDSWACVAHSGLPEYHSLDNPNELFANYTRPQRIECGLHPFLQLFGNHLIVVPVHHKKQPIAMTLMEDCEDSDDVQFISAITNIVAVAIENKRLFKRQLEQERLKRDLELAVQVQNMLIPAHLPQNNLYEFAGIYQPHEGVGGDYYDFIELGEDEIAFCIADISGKGVAAALLMSNFQASLQSLIHRGNMHVKKFISNLNSTVLRTTKGDKFITFFLARYHLQKRRLRYLCAGHNPPIMMMNGKLHRLEKGCTILGAFTHIPKIEMGEIYLDSDAFFFLYTDGLTDLRNKKDDFFGDDRLESFIQEHHKLDVQQFNNALMSEINSFRGDCEFPDDISVLTGRLFGRKEQHANPILTV